MIVLGILLRGRERSRATWWLTGFFGGLAGTFGMAFLLNSFLLSGEWSPISHWCRIFSLGCLLQFAYHFPQPTPSQTRAARVVLVLSGLALLANTGLFIAWFQAARTYPGIWSRVRNGGAALTHPVGKAARATRAFALVLLSPFILAVWYMLYRTVLSTLLPLSI